MRQFLFILCFLFSLHGSAQCSYFDLNPSRYGSGPEHTSPYSTISFNPEFSTHSGTFSFVSVHAYSHDLNSDLYSQPPAPVLTTAASELEVCEGNSCTLTATSEYPIEWYTNYPPEGEPVAIGKVFITPPLSQGYYIYHAVANNNGIKSVGSEMEVVMVYPLPFIQIVHSSEKICAGETVTLTAFGTRHYTWNTGETGNEIVIQPTETSLYKVTGMNTAGCKNTQEFVQHVDICDLSEPLNTKEALTKPTEMNPEKSFSSLVYPNPNSGEFQLKINSISEFTRIQVYNSYGELIYEKVPEQELDSIKLPNAPKGIYTIRLLEQNTLVKQEKLIIEN